MSTDSLASVRRHLRRLRWRYQSIAIRQAARRAFDLTGFGSDAIERIASSLILGVVFFGVGLAAAQVLDIDRNMRLALAGGVFVSVTLTSVVLILWGIDTQIERERVETLDKLAELEPVEDRLAEDDRIRHAEERADDEADEREQDRRRRNRKQACPYCGETIYYDAVKCRHCGEDLDEDLRRNRLRESSPGVSPGIAALLSFFIPGLGQLCQGRILTGMFWFFAVIIGHLLFCFPGFILRVVCIFEAAAHRPRRY